MKNSFNQLVRKQFSKKIYRVLMIILGLPTFIFTFFYWLSGNNKKKSFHNDAVKKAEEQMKASGLEEQIRNTAYERLRRQEEYFGRPVSGSAFDAKLKKRVQEEYESERDALAEEIMQNENCPPKEKFIEKYLELKDNKLFLVLSIITSLPFYILMLICANYIVRYMAERIVMMVFVMFGVVFVVFTILYSSPMDPATNILGEYASEDQIQNFNQIYGLDQPYIVQLFRQFKNLATFDLGKTYSGNEDVLGSIVRKFPVTVDLAWRALLLALVISIPIGVLSAIKPYSAGDYVFMFLAMVCLSLPVFWFGMVLILGFSINLGWLPAIFTEGSWKAYIMPSVVMGIHIVATLTRMTRSSMMEVIHEDYITTARSKGLSEKRVLIRHALTNALIPVITIVGLQVGSLLGGSSVSEKVFSVRGIGSYIVEKQMLPDIPAVLGTVVYLSVVIGIVNLFIDLLYAVIDPRIRSRLKNS